MKIKFFLDLQNLVKYRYLLWMWSNREVRLRYKQAFLGVAWTIIQPLALMLIFTFVFSIVVKIPSDGIPYPLFSYTALLPWTFISTSLSFGSTSLVNSMNLVTKVNIPREIIPLGAVLATLVDFLASLLVFSVLLIYYRVEITAAWVLIPVLILIQITLVSGVVLFLSAINVFFRDIRFAVPLFIQLWMYASPIIYPLSAVPENLKAIYLLNPVAGIIEAYRKVILHGQAPALTEFAPMAVVSALILVLGYAFFKSVDSRFADVI